MQTYCREALPRFTQFRQKETVCSGSVSVLLLNVVSSCLPAINRFSESELKVLAAQPD